VVCTASPASWCTSELGSLASVTLVMAGLGLVTLLCALAFPDL
jgi:hypothetical protein